MNVDTRDREDGFVRGGAAESWVERVPFGFLFNGSVLVGVVRRTSIVFQRRGGEIANEFDICVLFFDHIMRLEAGLWREATCRDIGCAFAVA